ncbi:MAG: hypothetical protein AAGG38_09275 [Planctomycetota bacterium]
MRRFLYLAMAGLSFVAASSATGGPFISEIFLPGGGATGVEVDGLDQTETTLLVLDASVGQAYRVRRSHRVGVAPVSVAPLATAVVAEPGWTSGQGVSPQGLNVIDAGLRGLPLDRATALVLVQGQTSIESGVTLGNPSVASGLLGSGTIVDWITLVPGRGEPMFEALSLNAQQTLGVVDLPRPATALDDAEVVARPIFPDGPRHENLVLGHGGVLHAQTYGWADFRISPGLPNPPTHAPEPGSGLALAGLAFLFAHRARHGRSDGV